MSAMDMLFSFAVSFCYFRFSLILTVLITAHITAVKSSENPYSVLLGVRDLHSIKELSGFFSPIEGEDVFVDTLNGRIRGKRRLGDRAAGGVASQVDWFLGVPFALPPVGSLRFKNPEPAATWTGVRDALTYSSVCPQDSRNWWFTMKTRQSEDCLYLNIYSPVAPQDTSQKLDDRSGQYPVLVYIHGGSYRVGTGNIYSGHILAQYGVIVVTINYRLGILGFLSARHEALRGNYGLHDQLEALSWIKKNIQQFGGDPNRVTIMGNSAGASSVALLSISPLGRGLFHQTIMQSGPPLAFWSMHNDTVNLQSYVRGLGRLLHCNQEEMFAIVECLRNKPLDAITDMANELPRISAFNTNFRPVVDGVVLLSHPRDVLSKVNEAELHPTSPLHVRALMTGFVGSETSTVHTLFLHDVPRRSHVNLDLDIGDGMYRKTFEKVVEFMMTRLNFDQSIANLVIDEYTCWTNVSDPIENRNQFLQLTSDLAMIIGTVEYARLAYSSNVPTYMYTFSLDERNPLYSHWKTNHHQVELNYVFGCPFYGADVEYGYLLNRPHEYEGYMSNVTEEDKRISRKLMRYWSNFAIHGRPSDLAVANTAFSSLSAPDSIDWKRFNSSTSDYLDIVSDTSSMRQHLRARQVAFWTRIVPSINAKLTGAFDSSRDDNEARWHKIWIVTVVIGCLLLLAVVVVAVIITVYLSKKRQRSDT